MKRPVIIDSLAPDPFLSVGEARRRATLSDPLWVQDENGRAQFVERVRLEGRLEGVRTVYCPAPDEALAWSAANGAFLDEGGDSEEPEPDDSDPVTAAVAMATTLALCGLFWVALFVGSLAAITTVLKAVAS